MTWMSLSLEVCGLCSTTHLSVLSTYLKTVTFYCMKILQPKVKGGTSNPRGTIGSKVSKLKTPSAFYYKIIL